MTIAVINQKGGTGKTTTTINLGSALTKLGSKVMLVDLDPQGNLSYAFGINQFDHTILDVMRQKISIEEAAFDKEGMQVIPSNLSTSKFHIEENSNDEFLLKEALSSVSSTDYILIDCPPSLSAFTINALCAADTVLIPMQLDVFSIQGLQQIMQVLEEVKQEHNPNLTIAGVLPVLVDQRRLLTKEIKSFIHQNFKVKVFESFVRNNVKAAEAPSFGKSVIAYAPNSNSAKDYMEFGKEWIAKSGELNQMGIQ